MRRLTFSALPSSPRCAARTTGFGLLRSLHPSSPAADRSTPPLGLPARVPRILFFGGDMVSVTALQALCARFTAIYANEAATGSHSHTSAASFLAAHLAVVAPSLPQGVTPAVAASKFSRQFPVVRFAVENGLPIFPVDHPKSLAKSELLKALLAPPTAPRPPLLPHLNAVDVAVVVSFRYFLPQRLLRALPVPVLNVHPSLLPYFRGASPIFSTLLRHEKAAQVPQLGEAGAGGVTILELHADQPVMDGGRILWQRRIPIEKDTDLRSYFPLVTQVGAAGCCEILFGPGCDAVLEPPQPFTWPPGLPTSVTRTVLAAATKFHHGRHPAEVGAYPTREEGPGKAGRRRLLPQPPSWVPLFAGALAAPHSEYPHALAAHAEVAAEQDYPKYQHFSMDPFHAPILSKDAAVMPFEKLSEREAFGIWRAFAGGACYTSPVNTVVNRRNCPVGDELLLRASRRLLRDAQKGVQGSKKGGVQALLLRRGSTHSLHHTLHSITARLSNTFARPGAFSSFLSHLKEHPTVDVGAIMHHAEELGGLRQACSFTEAAHPDLVPPDVRRELQQVEELVAGAGATPTSSSGTAGGGLPFLSVYAPRCAVNFLHHRGGPTEMSLQQLRGLSTLPESRRPWCFSHADDLGSAINAERRDSSGTAHLFLRPGSAYFPAADPSYGAVKCQEGWFVWRAAHLSGSPVASQPVALLRKGLAMKCGTVYMNLFVAPPASPATVKGAAAQTKPSPTV